MSTPIALKFNVAAWKGVGWRAVEAQHKNATLSLVHGDLNDQELLENIIEEVKPVLPPAVKGLHWLLGTPFRYPPPPSGSRFRARLDPGVFYGAEDTKTACSEAGFWRLRFWQDSTGLSGQSATIPMTLFEFQGQAASVIDLTLPPFLRKRKQWIDPVSYTATQLLGRQARSAGIELIRYESVRNGPEGRCLAILDPAVFKAVPKGKSMIQQTWSLLIEPPNLTVWQRSLAHESFTFRY